MELPGYQIDEKIYEGPRTLVYRGIRLSSGLKVVIKLMRPEYPTFSELVQFRNQYAISKNLNLPGIVKSLSLEPYNNGYALIMEDTGGISLDKIRAEKEAIDLETGLKIGIQLAEILHKLYQNRVIHKDIKPANILVNPETKEVKLIDFSIASLLPREAQEIQNPNQLEGTLAYISPEQTGRMNRGIDYRSDFYGLGVTLYELLAGELPFISDDSMELVHSHLSKEPPALGNIPPVLSDIVLKLMAKNAEERYQSALGLKFDLEKCLSMWQKTGSIAPFELGERDLSDHFLIPEKLYGREIEVKALLDAFDRIAIGTKEMMLVAGFSGIGKTAAINEVHKPIVRARGYFIKGKFDQFQRNIPFSALVRAFRDLMGQLLGESDSQLENWKTKILDALGENGQVIIEVIPELEGIIGTQPPVPELSGSAAQNRFNRLFQQFIRVFTSKEHPLVIFVDDLQWADSASLKLMELLMGDSETGYLLLLGAYRDNEVFPAHPLMLTLDEIAKSGANLNTITLAPLSQTDLNRLVADTLSCSFELALPLTELVYQKTKGNPFFATQFLKGLHEDGWIAFNADVGYWQCDIARVRELALTDDVVEFMAARLQKLPEASREILKVAACIGDRFDLRTIAIAKETSPEETATDLWFALKEGLILPLNETYKFYQDREESQLSVTDRLLPHYKFLHDRVQQAAYSLIPDREKQSSHLKIGQLLQKNLSEEERAEKLFDIVRHLNLGIDLISDFLQRKELARLNQIAGKKARMATAYEAAISYFQVGIALLADDCWQHQYDLALALYTLGSEAAFLSSDFAQMEQWIATVIENAKTILDRAKVYEVKILALIGQNHLLEAVNLGLSLLDRLGITFPTEVQPHDIEGGFEETRNLLLDREISELVDLPAASDSQKRAAMRILANLTTAAYKAAPELFGLTILKQVNLSILHGNTAQSAFAYSAYGMLLCVLQGNVDAGYEFGQLALNLLNCDPNKIDSREVRAKTVLVVYLFIYHRKFHVRKTMSPLLSTYTEALEIGDFEFAAYCVYGYCLHSYLAGEELTELAETMTIYARAMVQLQQQQALSLHEPYRQAVLQWLGRSDICFLTEQPYKFSDLLTQYLEKNNFEAVFYLYLNQLILKYSFEDYSEALELAASAESYLAGSMTIAVFYFYDSLIRLAWCRTYAKPDASVLVEQASVLEKVANNLEQLQVWTHHAPMNYRHKVDLIEAERHQILGQRTEAMEAYDRAIAGAKENEFFTEEALANELAAKFYLDWGKEKVAASYMQEAYYCYARWGAKAKVEDLVQRYRALLKPILEPQKLGLTPTATIASLTKGTLSKTTTGTGQILDLATLMKAAGTLSEDIELKGAIANLMQVARENAGAQTVALMLFQDSVLMLTALLCGVEEPKIDPIPVEASKAVPLSVINQVKRRRQALVLDDASSESAFAGDAYIQSSQPKSILCLPLIARGKLIGILYLENNRVAGAFTRDRLEILNLLCSQAAISLENARLYEQSTDYAQKLESSLEKLQAAQLQLIHSEKMSALGNLVAGVAHEINNPVGFIAGNLEPTLDYVQELFGLIELCQQKTDDPEIEAEIERIDLQFVRDDLLQIISAMQEGTERLTHISTSLRTFSRTDKEHKVPFQLQDGIESTLLILKHRLKANKERPEIEVERNYEEMPKVKCYPGQLNQVFMNLLANAIDAMDEGNAGRSFGEIKANPNRIFIETYVDGELAVVKIADNGVGMPEAVKQRIFEQGFTTKAVGKGTGLGMAIAYQIVVEKHGGTLTCTSEVGRGTEFCIALPLTINN